MLSRLRDRLALTLRLILGLALIAMVVVNVLNAVGRYLGGWSLVGADELLVFVMIWVVMLGAVLALLEREHLAIDLLPELFGPNGRHFLALLAHLLILFVSLVIAQQSWLFIEKIGRLGQVSMGLGVPMVIPPAAVLVGFVGLALVAAILAVSDLRSLLGSAPRRLGQSAS